MMVDEAAFIKLLTIAEGLLPILLKPPNAMICISTDNPDGVMDVLRRLPHGHNDPSVFRLVSINTACDPCKARGREAAEECNHNSHFRPPFKSARRERELGAFFHEAGMSSSYAAEMLNMRFVKDYYSKEHVRAIETNLSHPSHLYSHVVIGVDPTGGQRSDLALVAVGIPNDLNSPVRVLGVGLFDCSDQLNLSTAVHTRSFFKKISSLEVITKGNTPIYVGCENVPEGPFEIVYSNTSKFDRLWVVHDQMWGRGRGLAITDTPRDELLVNLGNYVTSKGFGFTKDCFGMANEYKPTKLDSGLDSCLVRMLKEQIANMNYVKIGNKDKVSGKSNGMKDDGVMALGHALMMVKLMPRPGASVRLKATKVVYTPIPGIDHP